MKYSVLPLMLAVGLLVGCQSEPQPAPGMAGLRVKVMAEQKNGAAGGQPSVYDQSVDVGSDAIERIDYANLKDIVVWVEGGGGGSTSHDPPKPVTVDVHAAAAPPGLSGAAGVGQTIIFHNAGFSSLSVYCVSDGNPFNLGTLAPFSQASYVVRSAGLIEVLSDAVGKAPIARIYAAPVSPVYITRSGATLDFTNLTPGHYTVVSWHPRLPGSVAEIDLTADHVGHATIGVGVNGLPKVDAK